MKSAMETRKPNNAGKPAPKQAATQARTTTARPNASSLSGLGQGGRDLDLACLASDNFVSLPAWFPAAKAGAVLQAKGKRFALVSDARGAVRVADVRHLVSAPSTKSVAWCATALGPAVAPGVSFDEATRLMDGHGCGYLPVVLSGVIVGIVARDIAALGAPTWAEERVAA